MQPRTLTRRKEKGKFMLRILEKFMWDSKQDPDPDPPDPEKIIPDLQHCFIHSISYKVAMSFRC